MILVVVLYAMLGFTITLSKILLSYASPVFLVGTRMLIAGLCLSAYTYAKRGLNLRIPTQDWLLILQFTLFGVLIPHIARAWALQYLPAVKAALLFNLAPLFSAIFGYILLREKLTPLQMAGLLIGFAGLIPLFAHKGLGAGPFNLFQHFSIPDIVMLVAVASLSYALLVMQKLVRHHKCSPVLANGLSMLLAGIFACNAALIAEPVWIRGSVPIFLGLLILNIVASNFLCANLQAWLLKKHSPTFLSFASFLSPIFAAFYSWLFLNETISPNTFIAFILVLSGLGVYFYDGLRAPRRA